MEKNNKQDQQKIKNEEELDMEMEERDIQQSSFEEISQQCESEQSQIKQRQVFYIPEPEEMANDEQLSGGQMEAFNYLHGVRKEAGNIKQENKKKKQIYRQDQKLKRVGREKNQQKKIQNQPPIQSQLSKNKLINAKWLTFWQEQLINNWNCVVKNVKYLSSDQQIKRKSSIERESSLQIISRKPKINELISLPLGYIEELISNLSEEYFSIITNTSHNAIKNGKLYYYLWMYSLLALHRARAQYSIFQALASVNACVLAEIESKKQNSDELRGMEQFLVVCCILNKQFCQFNLANILSETAMAIKSIY